MKKKNSLLFIIIIVLIIVLVSLFFIQRNKQSISYFVFGDSGVFSFKDNKWSTIKKDNTKVFSNKFNVFLDNEDKGEYEIRYFNNKWYYFDDDMDSYDYTGDLFAYHSKYEIKLSNIMSEEINSNDIGYINKALKKESISISSSSYLRMNEKVIFDIDSDGKDEIIYFISNTDIMESQDKSFSTVFYVKNNRVYTLKLNVYSNDSEDYYVYAIGNFFTIGDSNKYYMSVYQFSDMNDENNGVILYGLNGFNKYKQVVSTNDKSEDKSNDSGINPLIIFIPIIIIGFLAVFIYKKAQEKYVD